MSTIEMVEGGSQRRIEEAERFAEHLYDTGAPLTSDEVTALRAAAEDFVYGPVVASNFEYFRSGEGVAGDDPELVKTAALTLASLTRLSSDRYLSNHADLDGPVKPRSAGWREGSGLTDSMEAMQAAMTEGRISLLPGEYAMSQREGSLQVATADIFLDTDDPRLQRVLADANYTLFFSNKTMASGAELHEGTLNEVVETDSEEQMPHLTRTNIAIGQALKGIAQQVEGITVIDTGSGTGATYAADLAGLIEAREAGRLEGFSLTGIESNPDFVRTLHPLQMEAFKRYGVPVYMGNELDFATAERKLGIIGHEVLGTIEAARRPIDELTVLTANYVWHRLPGTTKRRIIEKISELSANSILLLADLEANGSEVNRRYFNFGNNGPLNCGNIGMQWLLESCGYEVTQVSSRNAPESIHPRLVERIDAEAANDGFMWIAHKGEKAAEVVAAA